MVTVPIAPAKQTAMMSAVVTGVHLLDILLAQGVRQVLILQERTVSEKEFSCCSKRSSLKTGTPSKRPSADETYYSGRNGSSFDRKTSPKYEEKYKSPSTQVHSVGEIYNDLPTTSKQVPIPGKTYPDMVNEAKHVPIPGKTYPDKDTAEKHVPMQGKTEHDTDTAAKHVPIQGDIFNDTSTAVKHIRSLGEIYNDQPTTSKNVSIQGEIYNDTDTAAKDGRKESAHGRNSTPRVSISSNNVAPDVSKLASRPGSRDSTSVSSRRLKSVSFPQNEELPGTSRLGESSKANLYATSVSYVTTSGCFHVDKSSATDKGKKEKGLSPEESIIIDVERMPGLLTGSKPSAESLLKKEQENRKGGKK
ncbi:uncharacterized protein LOC106670998 [Cimex lectularius]|uniref:Uncharacterized protein n=1 Tax=Cimex lectularius TaxID=79782 RepID=A0A8I6TKW8_CIMLE|nr:uncharacterized protein LOC106670998 [Cimex lectularius]XP_024084843.1 uncharacterized protein LOC106670998 [Cimex lectularius]